MEEQIKVHIPVLMNEVLEYVHLKPHGIYVDVTLGGGGHTRAMLQAEPTCTVIGFDWDLSVIETVGYDLQQEFGDRFIPVWGNFSKVDALLKKKGIERVDGVLADFGTSQIQISNTPGLSIYVNTYLDMRLSASHFKTTAYDIVNFASEAELADIIYKYSDERYSRRIARAIVERRKQLKIMTTFELADVISSVLPYNPKSKIHPATKTFQAFRIVVNKELENIESFLKKISFILKDGGRLVCISFHSLEDRIVKQFLKEHHKPSYAQEFFFEILTKNVCTATEEELKNNRSARSAKLRAAIFHTKESNDSL